jgi:hypothetical protein
MTLSDVAPDAFFQLIETSSLRRLSPKQRPMDIVGTEAARSSDNNLATNLFPFKD